MRTPIPEIETKLSKLKVPYWLIEKHIKSLERWRLAHPQKIKRKRLQLSVYEITTGRKKRGPAKR